MSQMLSEISSPVNFRLKQAITRSVFFPCLKRKKNSVKCMSRSKTFSIGFPLLYGQSVIWNKHLNCLITEKYQNSNRFLVIG